MKIHLNRKLIDLKYFRHERRSHLILACIFFWSILLAICIQNWVLGSATVKGSSMMPTFHEGDWRICHKWALLFPGRPNRGDVVELIHPVDGESMVKRVIGLPGEYLQILAGKVYINNKMLHEGYLEEARIAKYSTRFPNQNFLIPAGHYFVMGDNRLNSEDSRYFGAVPRDNLIGIVSSKEKK